MPDFVYCGDPGRVYPSLPAPANGPKPGETYSLKKDPGDGRWQTKGGKKPAATSEKAPAKKAPAKRGVRKPATKSAQQDPAPAGDTKE